MRRFALYYPSKPKAGLLRTPVSLSVTLTNKYFS